MSLPRPGLVGITIRLVLGVLVVAMGVSTIRDTASFWDGYTDPAGSLVPVAILLLFTSPVVNELMQRGWGWWPSVIVAAGLGVAAAIGAVQGDAFGPPYGIYLWAWTLVFSILLGPAFLLAGLLRTPGCEMRSYLHLWRRARGQDLEGVACPGWIDRFDGVRLLGRF